MSAPATPESPLVSTRRPLNLWIPTLILIAYWVVVQVAYQIELGMFYRFISRTLALLVTLLFFLGWGMTRRHFLWKERFALLSIIVGTWILGGIFGDKSNGIFATGIVGLPVVLTLSLIWLWIARWTSPKREVAVLAIIPILVFSFVALLRWDGLDGRQQASFSWRWTPNAEQKFLQETATRKSEPAAHPALPPLQAGPADWTSFRGGERENILAGLKLGDWNSAPPKLLWRHRVGPGWSSLISVGDYLFTQEQRDQDEAVVCYGAGDGEQVWQYTSPDRFDETLSGAGPRATPTFADNRLYAIGTKGHFVCLDASTGKAVWTHNLIQETSAAVPQWGSATSPLVEGDLVIVFAGGKEDQGLLAFNRKDGELVWKTAAGTVTYTTPQIMTIADTRQIVMQDESGIYGVNIPDGKLLWKHPSPFAASFQPMLQPHLDADSLIIGWDAGLLRLKVQHAQDKWTLTEIWKSNRLKPSFNEYVIHKGYIYGLDDGILCCIDAEKGRRKWKGGRYGFGQLLLLPDADEILVLSEQGEVVRVAAQPDQHRELAKIKAVDGKTWNHPLLASNRLVVRNGEEIACFTLTP